MRSEPIPNPRSLPPATRTPLLSLAYQPIVSLSDGSIRAVEALTRVRLPLVGAIRPTAFVGLTESAGLSLLHTNWVIKEACSLIVRWQRTNRPLLVSVNVSARDVGNRQLVVAVSEALRQSGLYPSNLQLEITETSLLQSIASTRAGLANLRSLGVRIGIDDFGTGFSTLKSMLEVPADTVKLDRCFIRNVENSSKRRAVVRSAINLAHDLGMEVVAEGVETKEERAFLRAADCDSIQGYLVSPPMPISRLSNIMEVRMRRAGHRETSELLRARLERTCTVVS